jgi:hypothetical protein
MQHKVQSPVLPSRAELPHENYITSLITIQWSIQMQWHFISQSNQDKKEKGKVWRGR